MSTTKTKKTRAKTTRTPSAAKPKQKAKTAKTAKAAKATKPKAAKATKATKAANAGGTVGGGMEQVVARLREVAPESPDVRGLGRPATEAAIAKVAKAMGVPLPEEVVAMWRAHGDGVPIFEYAGLSPEAALARRKGLEALRRKGIFDDHELFPQREPRIQRVKWHTGWLPIAEDGGVNLWCIDLAPGPAGVVGQVIKWEVRGGAGTGGSVMLGELFTRYAAALPQFTFDESSGTYEGPFVDLLA